MSAHQQALLPLSCAGTLTRLPLRHYDNLELDITPYFCLTNDKPTVFELDSAGNQWSPDDLRNADAAAFRDRYHRLGPDLRARIARDGQSVRQLADVWFPTPLDADQKLPSKPHFLSLSTAQQKSIIDNHNAAVAARASDVASMIQNVAPEATVDPHSFAFTGAGPLLQVEAPPTDLRAIGDLDGILRVVLSPRLDEDRPASSAWFDAGQFNVLQYLGADGDGVSVADVLGSFGVYDSTYLGIASGACYPPAGPDYDCFCPAGAGNAPGPWTRPCFADHMQAVLSVLKNSWPALSGGAARHSSTLAGGGGEGLCGVGHLEQLIPWAVGEGATVINRSATNDFGPSRYLDCVAEGYACSGLLGYPSIVAAAGNGGGLVLSHLDNGLVVGGANDGGSSNRGSMTMYAASSWENTDNEELPQIVAPAQNIDVVSDFAAGVPGVRACNGTSFAAPQVAGAIASLQEQYSPLRYWPEAVIPIMLVSAFTDTAPGGPDGTWFNLDDSVDDKDGAGLLAGGEAWEVVYSGRKSPGNTAADRGFDYGAHTPSDWPQYTTTPVYNAALPPGDYLRVAAVLLNHPSCGTPATQDNCTYNTFPLYYLHIYNPGTGVSWWSAALGNNYKYLMLTNPGSTTLTLQINMYMVDWNGLPSDTWGLAWDSRTI